MLKKILKWIGPGFGIVLIMLVMAVGVMYFRGQSRFNQTYTLPVEVNFIKTIRTGVTPSDYHLSEVMPWKTYAKMSDDELRHLSLPVSAA